MRRNHSKALVTIGRLVSTTDMKMARKLGEFVQVKRITRGRTVRARIEDGNRVYIVGGELYELANA